MENENLESARRTARESRLELERLRSYISSLYYAQRLKENLDGMLDKELQGLLDSALRRHDELAAALQFGLEPRHRPLAQRWDRVEERPKYVLFLDECGGHELRPVKTKFPVFALCGLIVSEEYYGKVLDPEWRGFKARFLGSQFKITHEPGLRQGRKLEYRLRPTGSDPKAFEDELRILISTMDAKLIAAAIQKDQYLSIYPNEAVDAFLPVSPYGQCLDFILERFVHFLFDSVKDAGGRVIAESRGPREDAYLQFEYVRLQLEGTQFISDSWFRYQLDQTIEFHTKEDNVSGLQLADILARPIAEKVVNPKSQPSRWEYLKDKFYDGGQERPESYGLKAFPLGLMKEDFL